MQDKQTSFRSFKPVDIDLYVRLRATVKVTLQCPSHENLRELLGLQPT